MRTALLGPIAAALIVVLAGCNPIWGEDPQVSPDSVTINAPAPATAMLSGRTVTLAAGSTAHVTVGLTISCAEHGGDGITLTEDGCQYIDDGKVVPQGVPLTVSQPIRSEHHDASGQLVVNNYYPVRAKIPGLHFTFAQNPLKLRPPDGSVSTTDLAITADADVEPGTYTVYVGKTSGTSVLDTRQRRPLTITVTPPVDPTSTLGGTITDYQESWAGASVELFHGSEAMASGAVGGDGSFSLELPSDPDSLSPLDFTGCEGTISDPAALHTGASLLLRKSGSTIGSLDTSGPSGYGLSFFLYVDRATDVDMVCTFDSDSYSYDYDFVAPGWYAVFSQSSSSGSGMNESYVSLPVSSLPEEWTVNTF